MATEKQPLITLIAEGTVGGLARQLELLAATIPQYGCRLHMIVSCERDPEFMTDVQHFRELGIAVDVIPMRRSPSPWHDFRSFKAIKACLARVKPDGVHTHCSKAGILGRRAAFSLGIPAVHTPHVFSFEWESSMKRHLYKMIETLAATWCQRIIMLSDLQKQQTLEACLTDANKLVVIPNGVCCRSYHPASASERLAARQRFGIVSPETPVIGVAARLEPQKGMGNFFRAVRHIHESHPAAKILIAGTGSLEGECRARVGALCLNDVVVFCGNISHMQEFYHALDCFLLASLWEGLPYVILEAMASALPVVSTHSFGMEGLISNGETGLIAEVDDSAGLARHTCRVLNEPALAKSLGQRARHKVETEFSLDQWAERTACVYKALAATPRSSYRV